MAKKSEFSFRVTVADNGYIVNGSFYAEADDYGPLGQGEHVTYIAKDEAEVAEYAAKAVEQFKIRVTEQRLNAGNGAQQNNRAGNGHAVPVAVGINGH